jgi:hypothetical protein
MYLCDNNEGGAYAYRIYRDYAIEAGLIQRAKDFWENHVMKEILPVPSVPTKAAWREMAGYASSGQRYEMPPDFSESRLFELSRRFAEAKAAVDRGDESLEDARAELEAIKLQLAPYVFSQKEVNCGNLTLKWKSRKTRSVDYEAFKLAYPLLYARFVTEKENISFEAKMRAAPAKEMEAA